MYDVYDYGVVTHTYTHTHARARMHAQLVTTCPVKYVTTCTSIIFYLQQDYGMEDYYRNVSYIDIVD